MKLDMGRAWNDAVSLLRANQQVVLIVAGVFFFLPNLALSLLMPETMGQAETRVAGEPDFDAMIETVTTMYGEIWWQILLVSLASAIGMLGLLTALVERNVDGDVFPSARLALSGFLDDEGHRPAYDLEEQYLTMLRDGRPRDAAVSSGTPPEQITLINPTTASSLSIWIPTTRR